jgi:glutamate-1-semialdehyde aminotransferase
MSHNAYDVRPSEAYSRSLKLQELAAEELPEATSSNHRGRGSYASYPLIYMDSAQETTLVDVEGNEYIDFHGGVSAIITGHLPELQVAAVQEQLYRGLYFATTYELGYEAARTVNELLPASDQTKFINTDTEAVMSAIRLARG